MTVFAVGDRVHVLPGATYTSLSGATRPASEDLRDATGVIDAGPDDDGDYHVRSDGSHLAFPVSGKCLAPIRAETGPAGPRVNDTVTHPKFGCGTVVSDDRLHVGVLFNGKVTPQLVSIGALTVIAPPPNLSITAAYPAPAVTSCYATQEDPAMPTTTTLTFDVKKLTEGVTATRNAIAAAFDAAARVWDGRVVATPESVRSAYYLALGEGLANGTLRINVAGQITDLDGDVGAVPMPGTSWTRAELDAGRADVQARKTSALAPYDRALDTLSRLGSVTVTLPDDHAWVGLKDAAVPVVEV
jgi:hypothetical protein